MIHDAKIEITCDGQDGYCRNSLEYDLPYVYSDYSGNNGHYSDSEADIETFLKDEGGAIDGDSHYCEDCKGVE